MDTIGQKTEDRGQKGILKAFFAAFVDANTHQARQLHREIISGKDPRWMGRDEAQTLKVQNRELWMNALMHKADVEGDDSQGASNIETMDADALKTFFFTLIDVRPDKVLALVYNRLVEAEKHEQDEWVTPKARHALKVQRHTLWVNTLLGQKGSPSTCATNTSSRGDQ